MELNAKAAYIKGLMDGMNFDKTTNEGKLFAAMQELLEGLAEQVTEHDDAISQIYDELDAMDEDMDDLESIVYDFDDDDDDEDDEDDEDEYELTCPNCGTVLTVDEKTLMNDQIYCPNCHAPFDIEFEECDGNCDACDAEDVEADKN